MTCLCPSLSISFHVWKVRGWWLPCLLLAPTFSGPEAQRSFCLRLACFEFVLCLPFPILHTACLARVCWESNKWDHGCAFKQQSICWECEWGKLQDSPCKFEMKKSEQRYQRAKFILGNFILLNSFPAVLSSSKKSVVWGSNFYGAVSLSKRQGNLRPLPLQSLSLVLWEPGVRQTDWPGPSSLWPQAINISLLKAQILHMTNGRKESPCLGYCKNQLDGWCILENWGCAEDKRTFPKLRLDKIH